MGFKELFDYEFVGAAIPTMIAIFIFAVNFFKNDYKRMLISFVWSLFTLLWVINVGTKVEQETILVVICGVFCLISIVASAGFGIEQWEQEKKKEDD